MKLDLRTGAAWIALTSGTIAAASEPSPCPVFAANEFARRPEAPEAGRFPWPTAAEFAEFHEQQRDRAKTIPLFIGRFTLPASVPGDEPDSAVVDGPAVVEECGPVLFTTIQDAAGDFWLDTFAEPVGCTESAAQAWYDLVGDAVQIRDLDPDRLLISSASNQVGLVIDLDYRATTTSIPTAYWADWVYVTALVGKTDLYAVETRPGFAERGGPPGATDDSGLPDSESIEGTLCGGGEAARTMVEIMLTAPDAVSEDEWDMAAAAAVIEGDYELARQVYRHYRPVGRCSMDSRPNYIAQRYADVCRELGNRSCYLQLQIRVWGDQFDRVAYSSFGEQAHDTDIGQISEIGIDFTRFLRGLVLDFQGVERSAHLSVARLARGAAEAGVGEAFLEELRRLIEDPTLDETNRLRAAIAYAHLWLLQSNVDDNRLQRLEMAMAQLDSPRAVQVWLTSQLRNE